MGIELPGFLCGKKGKASQRLLKRWMGHGRTKGKNTGRKVPKHESEHGTLGVSPAVLTLYSDDDSASRGSGTVKWE